MLLRLLARIPFRTGNAPEKSITRLFAAQGIRILRQERAAIRLGGETLNLIGVDHSIKPRDRDRP